MHWSHHKAEYNSIDEEGYADKEHYNANKVKKVSAADNFETFDKYNSKNNCNCTANYRTIDNKRVLLSIGVKDISKIQHWL